MSTGNQIPEDLIARYLAGEAGSVEKRELESWAADSDKNAAILAAARKVWDLTAHVDLPDTDTDAAWNKMKLRMQESGNRNEAPVIPIGKTGRSNNFLRIAASIVAILGITSILFLLFDSADLKTYTALNQSLEIFLPDSSKVILEPGSELRFDEKSFAQSARDLELDGSALFDVVRNESNPFTIKTSRTMVRVLGTSFLVSDRKSADTASVTVITGKVRFSVLKGDTDHKDLTPGEKGFITKSDLTIQSTAAPVEELQHKLNKTIIFKETSLNRVCTTLTGIFGEDIRLGNDSLKNCLLTATFREQNLSEIIEIIAGTFNLEAEADNRGYLLKGTGCE